MLLSIIDVTNKISLYKTFVANEISLYEMFVANEISLYEMLGEVRSGQKHQLDPEPTKTDGSPLMDPLLTTG